QPAYAGGVSFEQSFSRLRRLVAGLAAPPTLRLMQSHWRVAMRPLCGPLEVPGGAALRDLRGGGGIRRSPVWLPAAAAAALASSVGRRLRWAARTSDSPLQVRGLARPGAGACRRLRGPPGS